MNRPDTDTHGDQVPDDLPPEYHRRGEDVPTHVGRAELVPLDKATPATILDAYPRPSLDLVARTVVKGGRPSADQLALFLWRCRETGLDPFLGQIVGVIRSGELAVQTTLEGYRAAAFSSGKLLQIGDPEFDREPEPDDKQPPKWARVEVERLGPTGQPMKVSAKVRFSEFRVDKSPFWRDRPWHMLGLRAEAHALKKAFPDVLGGIETHGGDERDDGRTVLLIESEPVAPETKRLPRPTSSVSPEDAEAVKQRVPAGARR